MKNALLLFATLAIFVLPCPLVRAQTDTTRSTPQTRFLEAIADENKYDPGAHVQTELPKTGQTQAPSTVVPDVSDKTASSVPEPPKPDVILEPMIVIAKRDPFVQIELARIDNLIAVLEEKLTVSRLEEVINNPKIKLPLFGGQTYDVRVASVQADIESLQRQHLYLRFMQVAQTPEEYQRLYAMWHYLRYGREAPASKVRKLMNSDAVKTRFASSSTIAAGTSSK